jgi:cysteine-rich repeat protein
MIRSALVVTVLAGCNSILGIDTPSRRTAAVGGAAGVAAAGGSGGAAGANHTSGGAGGTDAAAGDSGAAAGAAGCPAGASGECGVNRCGDRLVRNDETCDDGDTDSGDGCSAECQLEAISLASRINHTCALLGNGAVKCWGENTYGELGVTTTGFVGDQPGEMGDALQTVPLGTGRTARQIAVGGFHSCALLDDDRVKCWGYSREGQVGGRDDPNGLVALGDGRTALMVAAGQTHSCAVLDDYALKCWGSNASGQLGQGDTNHRGDASGELGEALPPIDLGVGRSARQVVAGAGFTCALLDDSSVKCWGGNSEGQLGQGDLADRGSAPNQMGAALPPIPLGDAATVGSIAAGAFHVCALFDNDRVKCWGYNGSGQLGLGDTERRGDEPGEMGNDLPFVELGATAAVRSIAAGGNHTCASLDNGLVKCWGGNASGALGLGHVTTWGDGAGEMASLSPVWLGNDVHVELLALGQSHSCALFDDGIVKCWGATLGYGDMSYRGDGAGEMGDALPPILLVGPP